MALKPLGQVQLILLIRRNSIIASEDVLQWMDVQRTSKVGYHVLVTHGGHCLDGPSGFARSSLCLGLISSSFGENFLVYLVWTYWASLLISMLSAQSIHAHLKQR